MKRPLLYIFLWFLSVSLQAQTDPYDSLQKVLRTAAHDTTRYNAYLGLGNYLQNSDPDSALYFHGRAQKLAEKLHDDLRTGEVLKQIGWEYYLKSDFEPALKCYREMLGISETFMSSSDKAILDKAKRLKTSALGRFGTVYYSLSDYPKALEYYFKAMEMYKEIDNKKGQAINYSNIGIVYADMADYRKALDYYFKALKLSEETGHDAGIAISLGNIGIVYGDLGEHKKALEYYQRALKMNEEANDVTGQAINLGNIGQAYVSMKEDDKALEYYSRSIKIHEKTGNKNALANNLMNIGGIYHNKLNSPKALDYYFQAVKIQEELGDKIGLASTYGSIGAVYLQTKNYAPAEKYLKQAEKLNRELNTINQLKKDCGYLSQVYSATGKPVLALQYYKEHIALRDSVNREENQKASIQKEMQFNFEKKSAADSVANAKKQEVQSAAIARQQAEIKAKKNQQYALYGGLALTLVFAGFMYNRFKITQKQKAIIEIKEKETQAQKHVIEEKHKEITDSINYAERIQRSFLATKELLDQNLEEYFVFFKPKDIVSGDFYWAAEVSGSGLKVPGLQNKESGTKNQKLFYLATADSTGHGVPGAIMSILNISSLEKALEKEQEPAQILNATRRFIIERLKKDGSAEGGKDGMDCSLILLDKANKTLQVAAANNPVWIVRKPAPDPDKSGLEATAYDVIELKPDKMPVGKHDRQDVSFTQHTVNLQAGDMVYTLTDGFPDQFGGKEGKKFKVKQLRELLAANAHLPMQQQKELLERTFKQWIGNLEQVDDVTVIGIRV